MTINFDERLRMSLKKLNSINWDEMFGGLAWRGSESSTCRRGSGLAQRTRNINLDERPEGLARRGSGPSTVRRGYGLELGGSGALTVR